MKIDKVYWLSRMESLMKKYDIPGTSVSIYLNGEIYNFQSGKLHLQRNELVNQNSLFQIGSITKVYTAIMILKLVEQGKIELNTKVNDILQIYDKDIQYLNQITIDQLLSHTSGLTGDYYLNTGRGDDCLQKYVAHLQDIAFDASPDEVVSYSSVGYNLLGSIIENITGFTWDDALYRFIIKPMNMNHTETLPENILNHTFATGHYYDNSGDLQSNEKWNTLSRSSGPYGGTLCSSAENVTRSFLPFLALEQNDELLNSSSKKLMTTPQMNCHDKWTFKSYAWGRGFSLYNYDKEKGFGHEGSMFGQYSYVDILPTSNLIITILVNGGKYQSFYHEFVGELIEYLNVGELQPLLSTYHSINLSNAEKYIGTYKREGLKIEVYEHENQLMLTGQFIDSMAGFSEPITVPLEMKEEDVFIIPLGTEVIPIVFIKLNSSIDYSIMLGMRIAKKL
ncbi:serine hydrolase domain-containing protein [Mammaliicoccus stepanovicii]|uniref:Beta-lactamase n=1 Tax=Mammaliicoccus stepanovicii TaxID=643214 RepID=A0A239ZHN2_9STAP|nr:serine hydrolase domain-containing protein [Mammaliicoccus stepanovicii]PNZ77975.1 hypothetical protein CD111_03025 [Mammaliicoccus stepanovicii]GGI41741.1 hypothetical protein GCM10010896_14950 [Mammaliicoccus stepanovicii]SNV70791.1 beta-lactamase [Mammaliicoccus stepanovicii]